MAGMVSVSVDKGSQKELMESIRALHLLGDEPLEQIMRNQGRLFAINASKWTKIYGSKPVTGKMQKAAIDRSIKRTYKSPNKVAGAVAKKGGRKAQERFMRYIRGNNTAKAQEMIDNMQIRVTDDPWGGRKIKIMRWDNGNEHRARRKKRDMAAPSINYVVTNYKKVEAYARKEGLKAGELKSGWAKAAEMLGKGKPNPTRGIPAYAKKGKHKTKGQGTSGGSIGKKWTKVSNLSDYANSGNMDEGKALALSVSNLKKVTDRIIKRSARDVVKSQRARSKNLGIAAKTVKNALKMI